MLIFSLHIHTLNILEKLKLCCKFYAEVGSSNMVVEKLVVRYSANILTCEVNHSPLSYLIFFILWKKEGNEDKKNIKTIVTFQVLLTWAT